LNMTILLRFKILDYLRIISQRDVAGPEG